MAYLTQYTLKILSGDPYLLEDLRESNDWAKSMLNPDGSNREEGSWYEHEDDLREFSRLHPDTLFELSGIGEQESDMWKKYFKGGKMQECRAVLTYEPYNEEKLK